MATFSCSLCKSRICEIKKKVLNILREKKDSLQHPIDKAGSTTSFSSENTFSSVNLSAEKLKSFINDSDNKENENNIDTTG